MQHFLLPFLHRHRLLENQAGVPEYSSTKLFRANSVKPNRAAFFVLASHMLLEA